MKIFYSLTDPDLTALLAAGAVGVMPTDTVYGLVARADRPESVARMYALKQREAKPGTSIAASVEQLQALGLPTADLDRVAHLWPNPISVVMPHPLTYIHQGRGDSPFRVVADPVLQGLLTQTGPLVTTSANAPGEPTAHDLASAQAYFGDQVDFYVDDARSQGERPASTIIGLSDDGVVVFRQGAIKVTDTGDIDHAI